MSACFIRGIITGLLVGMILAIALSCTPPKPQHPYPLCEVQKALPRTPDPRRDYQILAQR